jgi:hypothetical protein
VITLVYFGIGQSDIRQSASTRNRADVQGAGTAVADYIAQRVADGVFAINVQGSYVPPAAASPSRPGPHRIGLSMDGLVPPLHPPEQPQRCHQ